MITPAFSLTATERVLPRLALDFTTASLDSRITFTRTGNTATVTNSSGFVVPINANLPRFDFDAAALTCKGLLIEESRTNLCLYSENLSLGWANVRSTSSVDAAIAPSNTLTADKLIEDSTAGDSHFVLSSYIASVSGTYTATVYLKAAEDSYAFLGITDLATGGAERRINLSTGVVDATNIGGAGSWTSISGSSTNAGNGWWRMTVTATQGAGASIAMQIYIGNSAGARVFSGNGVNGIYVWGAQVELASFATSYIPTTTLTVARNVDVAVMTSTNFSSWYTATTGAAVVWAIPQAATSVRPLIQFDDATLLKIIALRGNVADPELYIVDTVAQAQIDAGTIVANTAYKLSGAWNTNNCAAAKDGGTVGTDVVATIPAPTQLRIGSDGTNYASAWIQKIMYWPQRIINAEVQAISK
ncbi:hypothetical protein UFOVP1614_33 [uncultured Caudovirales phage]|uniref:Uncharacterized protein n=1 Tax=uncultured Caudovirales phage TaxID=2100421 RepID=A0A6J5Q9U6_9CAUD|nr:hypothetical protein UFOVP508_44 [uncultured Caudovirales phage]CAB4178281.1 hypothetical protein UFOVP1012_51 [uncultured Caudovirales phage]CAB4188029.1 hypothetical protein UFOVP1164_46 [uncultured Caudovirales phage]CAB4219376.1 hypothetical protein UFOVP1614_33 [uncultured Caudovirales phage]